MSIYGNEMRGTKVLCNTGQTLILPVEKVVIDDGGGRDESWELIRGENLDGYYWHVKWNGRNFFGVAIEAEDDEQAILKCEYLMQKKHSDVDGSLLGSDCVPVKDGEYVPFSDLKEENISNLRAKSIERWG